MRGAVLLSRLRFRYSVFNVLRTFFFPNMKFAKLTVIFSTICLFATAALAHNGSTTSQDQAAQAEAGLRAIADDEWNTKAYTELRVLLLGMKRARDKGTAGIPDPAPYWERLINAYPNNVCAQGHYGYWKPFKNADAFRKQIEPILLAHREPRGNSCAADQAGNLAKAFSDEGDYTSAKLFYEKQKTFAPKDAFVDGYIKEMAEKAHSKLMDDAVELASNLSVGTRRIVMENGDVYVGEVNEEGKPAGKGKLEMPSGSVYEGGFLKGKPAGRGVYKFYNGRVYEGEMLNGTMHGKGRFNMIDSLYTGDFYRGRMTGKGTLVWLTGSTKGAEYEGEFVDGKFHGYGSYLDEKGHTTRGMFQNGKLVKQCWDNC